MLSDNSELFGKVYFYFIFLFYRQLLVCDPVFFYLYPYFCLKYFNDFFLRLLKKSKAILSREGEYDVFFL